ncbi:MAG: hypothetical protein ABI863_19605 [Ginsengibacter sp.]
MKKYLSFLVTTFVALLFSILFSGCLKDTCKHTYTYSMFTPVYKTTTEVMANIKSNSPLEISDPGKIVILGNYIFLNEVNKGIHVIDNTNPSSPKNIAFIDLPGNVDLAVKGHTLYADLYTDLVVLDISNPLNVTKTKVVSGVFPQRNYGPGFYADGDKIITDWVRRDTTIIEDCAHPESVFTTPNAVLYAGSLSSQSGNASSAPVGIAGSMARFALVGDYLYTVDDANLNIFDLTNSNDPVFKNQMQVDWHVETIYPFKNNLFIGSNNGMFIFNITSSPANPTKVGEFTHVRSCDPVIADDSFAFVTLHSGTTCLGFNNELDVVKLNDLSNAELVKTYSMTSPQGLSKDGKLLFICDGTDGLKVYDASDVQSLQLVKQFTGIETYDVIAYNKIAIVVAKDGLYQYDYSDLDNIHSVSKINISK